MTSQRPAGVTRNRSIAVVGAVVAAIGLLAGVPIAIAAGLLVCWGGAFMTLIAYLDSLA